VKIQEQPDAIPEGETPHTVKVYAFDDLVDVPKPGDRVEITGVYRAMSSRLNPRRRTVKTVFKTYIDAVHIKKADKGRFGAEDAHADKSSEFFTSFDESDTPQYVRDQQIAEYKAMVLRPNFYSTLARSLAPSIWQMEDVKKGILCQLFGGANLSVGASHGRFRGELNILLCGDPGTSKSQLLQYVHKIAPRGMFLSLLRCLCWWTPFGADRTGRA
jgi:DNA replication licensing factor MCM4